ncbi:hypothetical protein O181_011031 [Austropuccinia psidii MF-1]|uniref:Chromo domain-containing protein n=1 Tax=Austropuccinia psidii MF-1 TaxID=1389203 RepID=A0A9Q3BS55_9BASI|nr:hypothetical protein [Austropuccinia psidii MF-1]
MTDQEPDFREGNQVLVSTPNFNNLKGPEKMEAPFVGPFNTLRLIGNNAVKVRITDKLSRKHPVLPVSLVKPYPQTGEDMFPSRNKSHTPQDIVEVEASTGPVRKIMNARKIRLNGEDHRQYFLRFKTQKSDKDKWLAEDAIPYGDLSLGIFRYYRRAEYSHQL